jgi:penicillin-binding protein A
LTMMMVETVANGSAYKSFHDASGRAFLPGIEVAGKTGTLTRHKENRHYTWFIGFAPVDKPEVAVAALVVNTPTWHIKGPELARDVLRSYFAKKGVKGIVAP